MKGGEIHNNEELEAVNKITEISFHSIQNL